MRKHMQLRRLRTAVDDADPDENVFRSRLGVFHEDIEVTVVIEDPGIEQFEFHVVTIALLIALDEFVYGNAACGYLYSIFM